MWMTSSSHADARLVHAVLFIALVWCVASSTDSAAQTRPNDMAIVAPDAPRPQQLQPKAPPLPTNYEVKKPVELRSVTVGHLTKEMESLAGPGFLKTAKEPLFIKVMTIPGVLG